MELTQDQKQALRRLATDAHQSGMKVSVRRFVWALDGVDPDYAEAIVTFWQTTWAELEAAQA